MLGALLLAGRACLRSGVGLARLALPESQMGIPPIAVPEATSLALPEEDGVLCKGALEKALEACGGADAVGFGMGLRTLGSASEFARAFVASCPLPLVLDADGLNAFAGRPEELKEREAPTILTPHPGEAARLLGLPGGREVQRDREGAARALASSTGAVVVLKGAGTLVCEGARLERNATGNPGMATGGSGDVLTGICTGLLAQGMPAFDAARLAVWAHGRAGDLAAAEGSRAGLIASDLVSHLPRVWAEREGSCS